MMPGGLKKSDVFSTVKKKKCLDYRRQFGKQTGAVIKMNWDIA